MTSVQNREWKLGVEARRLSRSTDFDTGNSRCHRDIAIIGQICFRAFHGTGGTECSTMAKQELGARRQ